MVSLGVSGSAREAVSAVQAMCLLTVVLAEPFHVRRDHLDQGRYVQTEGNDNVVRDRDDAKFMLSKYGYLRCQIRRRRRRETGLREGRRQSPHHTYDEDHLRPTLIPWSGHFSLAEDEGAGGEVEVCDDAKVQDAIREYQSTYNLTATGELNEETMQLMSTSRCGNKDNDLGASIPDNNNNNNTQNSNPGDSGGRGDGAGRFRAGTGASPRLRRRAVSNRVHTDHPSHLLRVLAKSASSAKRAALSRHRRYLQEYLRELSRRDPDSRVKKDSNSDPQPYVHLLRPWSRKKQRRARRSIKMTATSPIQQQQLQANEQRQSDFMGVLVSEHRPGLDVFASAPTGVFNKNVIRWRLLATGYSTRIPVDDQKATLNLAFRMWSEVIPLRFVEDTTSDINQVDIEVAFGRGSHQNCEHDFDGIGGEIAHSQQAGNMHFDDEENFKSIRSYAADGIYLLHVAVHEIGHVLGLSHTNRSQSIMYAIYRGAMLSPDFELSREDRREVQKIYGVCKGEFSTVFDWVRRRPDNVYIYNTYFFRDNHYWMYENHANRTRYGDPLYIAREWEGVPNQVDGYLHVWYYTGSNIVNEAYFFKGEHYYKYDSERDRVHEGWPRLIVDNFGPKAGQTQGIPNNLDTVFFDMRDRNIYFFKGNTVYVYDPKEPPDSRGCCARIRQIREEFPPESENSTALQGNLDSVYYSYGDRMQYFIKGEDLWRNRVFDPRQRRVANRLEYLGKWYHKWFDICDVQAR